MENKKLEPALRFPGFTDAWEQRKLGEIANISKGIQRGKLVISSFQDNENVYPVYNGGQAVSGYTNEYNRENKVMISEGGASAGFVNYFQYKYWSGGHNFTIDNLNNDLSFLYSILQSKQEKLYSLRVGSGLPNIQLHSINDFDIFVPSVKEQNVVGGLFGSINNLITLHQRKLSDLQNLKAGLLQKMFPQNGSNVPEVRFPGFTDAWERRKLGDIGTTYSGLSGKSKQDFGHGDAEYVTYMNVFSNSVSDINQIEKVEIDSKQHEVRYGDIFFTTSSETRAEAGMSSVWTGKRPNTYLNSFCFGYRPMERFDIYYMGNMLRSCEVRKNIILLAQGISRFNISKTKLMEIEIPLPSLDEQSAVGQFLFDFDNLITLHQRKLENLQSMKKSLLQQMFI